MCVLPIADVKTPTQWLKAAHIYSLMVLKLRYPK